MIALFALLAATEGLDARWDGILTIETLKIPVRLQLQLDGKPVSGVFWNGEAGIPSTSGSFENGELLLRFDGGQVLKGRIEDKRLKGNYGGYAVEAVPFCSCADEGEGGPEVVGEFGGGKLKMRRKGEETFAEIAGRTYVGRFDGVSFQLVHFDGRRAALAEITPDREGKRLEVVLREPGGEASKFEVVSSSPRP